MLLGFLIVLLAIMAGATVCFIVVFTDLLKCSCLAPLMSPGSLAEWEKSKVEWRCCPFLQLSSLNSGHWGQREVAPCA